MYAVLLLVAARAQPLLVGLTVAALAVLYLIAAGITGGRR